MERIPCRLDPCLRPPGRRRLPPRPRTRPERRERRGNALFHALGYALEAISGLVDLILATLWDLVELLAQALWRELRRLFHGRCRSGGWDSEAGRFALTVFRHHWLAARSRRRTLRLTPAPEGVVVELPGGERHAFVCAPRGRKPPRRQRHRVDLAFPDGSWLALSLDTPEDARALRRHRSPETEPRNPYAKGSKSS